MTRPSGTAISGSRRLQRRSALVGSATDAIEIHGPDIRIEELAAHANIARPLLYRYFDGLADLQQAIRDDAARQLNGEIEIAAGLPHDDLNEVVDASARAYLTWVHAHPNLARFCLRDAASSRELSDLRHHVRALLSPVLESHLAGVPDVAMRTLVATVTGMAEATALWWLESPGDCDRDWLARDLSRRLVAVLDAESAHHQTMSLDLPQESP